tara:strand:+ start:270 stop:1073 length:804 start_codon:yes stop_codon:yes gene_type:complete
MSGWDALRAELAAWAEPATIWWRDDDAVSDTEALQRMRGISRNLSASVALAVIPAHADETLVTAVTDWPDADICQHGYAHVNHAPTGVKKAELGDHRRIDEVITQLREGRERLRGLFGVRAAPVLVPPWNRIGAEVLARLSETGLRALSTFKARTKAVDGSAEGARIGVVNTHVDIIDWRGTRGFVGESAALRALVAHLHARRTGTADATEPTGILTHHLVHDEACWEFLSNFYAFAAGESKLLHLRVSQLPWAPRTQLTDHWTGHG